MKVESTGEETTMNPTIPQAVTCGENVEAPELEHRAERVEVRAHDERHRGDAEFGMAIPESRRVPAKSARASMATMTQ